MSKAICVLRLRIFFLSCIWRTIHTISFWNYEKLYQYISFTLSTVSYLLSISHKFLQHLILVLQLKTELVTNKQKNSYYQTELLKFQSKKPQAIYMLILADFSQHPKMVLWWGEKKLPLITFPMQKQTSFLKFTIC